MSFHSNLKAVQHSTQVCPAKENNRKENYIQEDEIIKLALMDKPFFSTPLFTWSILYIYSKNYPKINKFTRIHALKRPDKLSVLTLFIVHNVENKPIIIYPTYSDSKDK